ncbi:MAG: hypothetical protein AAGA05_07410 [Pseudomonadota bacterium]
MMRVLWAAAVLVAALAFVVAPFLVPPFTGFQPDDFPVPQIKPPIQPAGYAFSIWGVIYVWLLVGAIFGLARRAEAVDWADMRPALALSLGIGATWLSVAAVSPVGATLLIWAMLAGALVALIRAPALDRWFARAPVALYAGWLTAASAVALGTLIAGYGLAGAMGAAWAMLALALAIGWTVLNRVADCAEYGIGLSWALVGILVANLSDALPLAIGAGAGAAVVGLRTWRLARGG